MSLSRYDICVLPGDGIGVEVIDATLPLVERACHGAGFALRFASHPAGARHRPRRSEERRVGKECLR